MMVVMMMKVILDDEVAVVVLGQMVDVLHPSAATKKT